MTSRRTCRPSFKITRHAEAEWGGARRCGCFVRVARSGHEGGGGERSRVAKLQNGAVDTGREAEVIGIEDEPGHEVPVYTGRWIFRQAG